MTHQLILMTSVVRWGLLLCTGADSHWTVRSPSLADRAYHAAAVIDGKVFVTPTPESPALLTYDPSIDKWTNLGRSPVGRDFPGAAAIDGVLYIVGGIGPAPKHLNVTDVDAYDTKRKEWKKLPPLPTPRSRLAAVALGSKLYAIGGFVGEPNPDSAALDLFDPATNRWTAKAAMPTPRHGHAAVVWRDSILVLGGFGKRPNGTYSDLNVVEEYDPATDRWTTRPPMPAPRGFFGAAVLKDKLYVVCGRIGEPRVDCLDLVKQTWQRLPDAPQQTNRFTFTAVGNAAYLIGGEETPRAVWRFQP